MIVDDLNFLKMCTDSWYQLFENSCMHEHHNYIVHLLQCNHYISSLLHSDDNGSSCANVACWSIRLSTHERVSTGNKISMIVLYSTIACAFYLHSMVCAPVHVCLCVRFMWVHMFTTDVEVYVEIESVYSVVKSCVQETCELKLQQISI